MTQPQVILRPVTEADLPDYVRWLNDPEVTQFTSVNAGNVTLEGERGWLAHISAPDYRGRHWAIEAEGRHIGNCALIPEPAHNKAGFGIIIGDKMAWGKGYGAAALRQVLQIAFAEMNLRRVHLTVFPENQRGLRCYIKCGFRQEGYERQSYIKGDKCHDIIAMAILREEWEVREKDEGGRMKDEAGPELDSGICIRAFTFVDYDQVMALWQTVGFYLGVGDQKEVLRYRLIRDEGPFLVAEINGRIVGTAMGIWDGGWGWIKRMAVHPDHQRRGLGRRLMLEAEKALIALGAWEICLLMHKENEPAARLYQSLGYELIEFVGYMRKRLE